MYKYLAAKFQAKLSMIRVPAKCYPGVCVDKCCISKKSVYSKKKKLFVRNAEVYAGHFHGTDPDLTLLDNLFGDIITDPER